MQEPKIIIAVGASAGGSSVLPALLEQLSPDLPVAVLIAMHLTRAPIGQLVVDRLQKSTSYLCKMPASGEAVQAGHVYVAMPDRHLLLKENKIILGQGPRENRHRPSINVLFRSAAVAYGPKVIGIILSGMLEDGASGMYAIRNTGGICMIQDPKEAAYPDMPDAVRSVITPDYSLPVSRMGDAVKESVTRLLKRKRIKISEQLLMEAQIAERVSLGIGAVEDLGALVPVSCPDCGGSLRQIKENGLIRYRCHTGHSFSESALLANIEESTESTLWVALRMMDERINILKRLATRHAGKGKENLQTLYLNQATELESHAEKLKKLLFSLQQNHPMNTNPT